MIDLLDNFNSTGKSPSPAFFPKEAKKAFKCSKGILSKLLLRMQVLIFTRTKVAQIALMKKPRNQ